MTLIAYISTTHHLAQATQEHWLRDYKVSQTFVDDLKAATMHMRKGRGIVVAQMSVLGDTLFEVKAASRRIHDRGGHIIEAVSGRDSRIPADAVDMGADATKRRVLSSDKARDIATKYPDDDQRIEKARKIWNSDMTSVAISDAVCVPLSTLNRRLGKRGKKPGPKPKQ